jgi:hypothetical protein
MSPVFRESIAHLGFAGGCCIADFYSAKAQCPVCLKLDTSTTCVRAPLPEEYSSYKVLGELNARSLLEGCHAAAAPPPTSVMNVRRFTLLPRRHGAGIRGLPRDLAPSRS